MSEEIKVEKTKKELYDEQKAIRDAKRAKAIKKEAKKQEKAYKNPTNSIGGKIIVGILSVAMLAGIIISLVVALLNIF